MVTMSPLLVTAAILRSDTAILVTQRKASAAHPLLWEFPGGKVEPGENPRQAVQRELKEELSIDVQVGVVFDVVFHRYAERDVLLIAYECQWVGGELQEIDVAAHCWVHPKDLGNFPFLAADIPLVQRLQAEVGA